ncbi:MAG: hypothetical protein R3D00_00405 [Bacteroidia bacterium]
MKKITGLSLLMFQVFICLAQPNVNDTGISAVKELYYKHIPTNQLLRSGRSYEHFYLATEGNQYLIDALAHSGELRYEGMIYRDVLLNYDIYNQLIFVSFAREGYQRSIILNEKRITYMDLLGMRFVYLPEDFDPEIPEGIYQEVFKGKDYGFWVKRRKKLNKQTTNSSGGNRHTFTQEDLYYIKNGGEISRFSNKKELLSALGNTQEAIALIKEHNLSFNKRKPEFVQNTGILLSLLEKDR